MNYNMVKSHIEYIRKDRYYKEFYAALLLYDVLGLTENEINEEIIEQAYDISDEYESIYNEDLRDRIRDEISETIEQNKDYEDMEFEK